MFRGKRKQKPFLPLRLWTPHLSLSAVSSLLELPSPTAAIISLLVCYSMGLCGVSVWWLAPLCLLLLSYWIASYCEMRAKAECRIGLRVQRERVLGNRERGEDVEWVNFALDRWWNCCMPTVNDFVKDWIGPIIDSFKLPVGVESIEVVSFDMGPSRPVLSNVRLLEQATTGANSFQPLPPDCLATPPQPERRAADVVFEVDVDINVPVSRFYLQTRLGQKRLGQTFILNIDSFRLTGCLRCFITADNKAPFPHITTAKISFVGKPHIEATCKILRETIEVFDIPVLRSMVMQYVFAGFDKLLVYPGGIDVDFSLPSLPSSVREKMTQRGLAIGVLTVTLSGFKPSRGGGGKERELAEEGKGEAYCSLLLGTQKCQRRFGRESGGWVSSFSFLVHSTDTQELLVKLKRKRHTMQSLSLASHTIKLSGLGLGDSGDDPVIRRVSVSGGGTQLLLTLHYSSLPSFSLLRPHPPGVPSNEEGTDAGVLYVHLHGAKNLIGPSGGGSCDLNCSVQTGSHTLLITQATPTTRHPIWEEGAELLVPSVADMKLRFEVAVVYNKLGSRDLLGSAHYSINTGHTHITQHRLPVTAPSPSSNQSNRSSLFISLIFRPVSSVQLTRQHLITDFVSRTRQTSLSSCLDQTTQLLNPHAQ